LISIAVDDRECYVGIDACQFRDVEIVTSLQVRHETLLACHNKRVNPGWWSSRAAKAGCCRRRSSHRRVVIHDRRPLHWPEVARVYGDGITTGNAV
jgi:hypothetical protein